MTDEHTGSMRIGQHMSHRAVQSLDHHSALSSLGGCSQRDAQSVSKHVSLFTRQHPPWGAQVGAPSFSDSCFLNSCSQWAMGTLQNCTLK